MPVRKGKDCVGDEMARFKRGELHSGKSKKSVKNKKQALAIALNVCGESKYSEHLQSMGYPAEIADAVTAMFAEIDWEKNFRTGKTPDVPLHSNVKAAKGLADGISGRRKSEAEMLSGPALPKGPGNPQGGSSKDVTGLRMFAEEEEEGTCPKKRKAAATTRTPEEKKADQERRAASTGKNNVSPGVRSEAAKKAAETRAKCKQQGGLQKPEGV